MLKEFEVQTRDDEGGLRFFKTLDEALEYARENSGVWKISFPIASGERVRLVRREWTWEYQSIFDAAVVESNGRKSG